MGVVAPRASLVKNFRITNDGILIENAVVWWLFYYIIFERLLGLEVLCLKAYAIPYITAVRYFDYGYRCRFLTRLSLK